MHASSECLVQTAYIHCMRNCDSPGLSDTGGGRIMVPTGGSKDERDEARNQPQAAAVF